MATQFPSANGAAPLPAAFTRDTQRKLTALRMIAYGAAMCFMLVMVVRGVWLTRTAMEAEAERGIASAAAAIPGLDTADAATTAATLDALAPPGVRLRLADPRRPNAGAGSADVRAIATAGGRQVLVAEIDHGAIWTGALRDNLPYVLLVLALGLPTILTFLYMGWLVNRPALQLLMYAQAGQQRGKAPPDLPRVWAPVMTRLQQLQSSRALMDGFLDHAPVGIAFVDASGALVMVNRRFADWFGEPADALIGVDLATATANLPAAAALVPSLLKPFETRASAMVETEFHAPSGRIAALQITSFPIIEGAGAVALCGLIAVDVTEQRETRNELDESRAQLIGFFDNLPTSVYLKRADHRIVYVSKHLAEQYGKRPEDMIGQHEYDMHIDAMQTVLKRLDDYIISTGQAYLTEGTHLQFNRQELVSRFPVFNDKGEITHIGGMNFDIDARAKAQAALEEAKALIEAFIQHAPDPMLLIDLAGRYAMINDAAAGYFGQRPEALLAAPPAVIHAGFPDAASVIAPMLARVIATRKVEAIDTSFVTPAGERREMTFSLFPILAADGNLAFVGNIWHDITEERRARAEAIATRASLQAFFDNIPGLAFVATLDGTIVSANAYLAEHFGLTRMQPDFLIGKNGTAWLPASWTADSDRAVLANRDGKPHGFEATLDLPGGTRHVAASRFPIRDAQGAITHFGGLVFDRTDEIAAREQIATSRERLHQSEKLAALGSMLAGVSHELNNPLAAVIGQAALLAEDLDGSEHEDRVRKIRRAADRCARIVASFLAMARQKAPEYQSVDLNDQIGLAVELTDYQMRAAGVTIDLHLEPGLPAIAADPDQLHQVIVNLLTNARQALEEVSDKRRIAIATTHAGDAISLSIADTGKGIDPATRDRIFDPFFTTKAVGSGTGIGLSYSRGIIEAHGGSIALAASAIGSHFVITLPIRTAPAALPATAPESAGRSRGRVLIIDDEADLADTLADMLDRLGLDPVVAIGGAAGQAAMAGGASFDLVLSDIRMPDLDGPALHAWMTAHRPDLAGAIAFVTGDTLSGAAADFLAAAGCPVLEKPFTPAGLRALVMRMLAP